MSNASASGGKSNRVNGSLFMKKFYLTKQIFFSAYSGDKHL